MRTRWTEGPVELTLVRHGESLGNQADAAAREAKAERLDLDERDADVALSDTGSGQADGVAEWLAGAGAAAPPDLVISSPYRRARRPRSGSWPAWTSTWSSTSGCVSATSGSSTG